MEEGVRSATVRAAPWGALAVSLIFHLTGLGISSAIVFAPQSMTSPRETLITAVIDPVISEPEAELVTVGDWQPEPAGGGSPNPAGMIDDSPPEEPQVGITSSGLGPYAFGAGTDLSYTDVIGLGGSGGGTGDGVGTGSGSGSGDGFFGLDLAGDRIVFVVDASRSMNFPYPGESKNRLGRVKFELYNTLTKMTPQQSFFVIFFNNDPIPMPARGMVRADPALVKHFLTWIFSARGTGQTNPESALLMALRLNPDKIYFLTDGGFSYRSVRSVREANRQRIPIHTIGFGGQEGENNLQEIARDSHGTYQYIPEPASEVATKPPEKAAAAPLATP